MPIWIKVILFCWFGVTPVSVVYIKLWAGQHPRKALRRDYPMHIMALGTFQLLEILTVIPFVFWLIFMR